MEGLFATMFVVQRAILFGDFVCVNILAVLYKQMGIYFEWKERLVPGHAASCRFPSWYMFLVCWCCSFGRSIT